MVGLTLGSGERPGVGPVPGHLENDLVTDLCSTRDGALHIWHGRLPALQPIDDVPPFSDRCVPSSLYVEAPNRRDSASQSALLNVSTTLDAWPCDPPWALPPAWNGPIIPRLTPWVKSASAATAGLFGASTLVALSWTLTCKLTLQRRRQINGSALDDRTVLAGRSARASGDPRASEGLTRARGTPADSVGVSPGKRSSGVSAAGWMTLSLPRGRQMLAPREQLCASTERAGRVPAPQWPVTRPNDYLLVVKGRFGGCRGAVECARSV